MAATYFQCVRREVGVEHDESLWRRYVTDSLLEAFLARDVMTGHWIAKPVLLRHLLCHLPPLRYSVQYWRDGGAEVDFVVARSGQLWVLEVKSGRGGNPPGLPAFRKRFPEAKALLVGGGGVPLEEFFKNPPGVWFDCP